MKKSRFTEAQPLGTRRPQDQTGTQLGRKRGVREPASYQWKNKYAGREVSELPRLRYLDKENRRLKQLVADLSLENPAVREALRKK